MSRAWTTARQAATSLRRRSVHQTAHCPWIPALLGRTSNDGAVGAVGDHMGGRAPPRLRKPGAPPDIQYPRFDDP